MNVPSVGRRIVVIVLAAVLFVVSGTMAWVAAADSETYDLLPARTFVAGQDIGGLTRAEARAVIQASVVDPVAQTVTAQFLGQSAKLDAAGLVSVNVDQMLEQAFAPRAVTTIDERVLPGEPVTATIVPVISVDSTKIAPWVADVARYSVDRPPVNAYVSIVKSRPRLTRARVGYKLDRAAAVRAIASAAGDSDPAQRVASLPVTTIQPKVPDSKFSRIIVVDKSERRLYLYRYDKVYKSFRVAVGQPRYPTPLGAFSIVQKRYRPTWVNPGSDWAKSMPAFIAPGPGNPLGTRALNLSAPGIRIHGTNKISSIGTAASHGCIRMVRQDIEWLYDQVPVGTPVYVVP